MRKKLIVGGIILFLALIVVGVAWRKSTAWERDLIVKYTGYELDYYHYEITNNTNRALKNVYAEIEVFEGNKKMWTFDKLVDTSIRAGETTTFGLSWNEVKKSGENRGRQLFIPSAEIKRIKYK